MRKLPLIFLNLSLFIYFSSAQISDKRLCVDPKCTSPVALAKTLRRYFSPDNYRLSFGPNEEVVIFSKSAGSDLNLWGAEINGKRGYIPKNLVRETKKIKDPDLLVDTEIINADKPQVPKNEEILNPSKVKESYEVIDGTTIYLTDEGTDKEEKKEPTLEAPTESLDSFEIDNIDSGTEEATSSSEIPKSVQSDSITNNDIDHSETNVVTEVTDDYTKGLPESENNDVIETFGETESDSVTKDDTTKINTNSYIGHLEEIIDDLGRHDHTETIPSTDSAKEIHKLQSKEDVGGSVINGSSLLQNEEVTSPKLDLHEDSSHGAKLEELNDNIGHNELDSRINISSEEAVLGVQEDVLNFSDRLDPSINKNSPQIGDSQSLSIEDTQFSKIKQESATLPSQVQGSAPLDPSVSENLSIEMSSSDNTDKSSEFTTVADSFQPTIDLIIQNNEENIVQTNISMLPEVIHTAPESSVIEVNESGNADIPHEKINNKEFDYLSNLGDVVENASISSDQKKVSHTNAAHDELQTTPDITPEMVEGKGLDYLLNTDNDEMNSGISSEEQEIYQNNFVPNELQTNADVHLPINSNTNTDDNLSGQNNVHKVNIDNYHPVDNNQDKPNSDIYSDERIKEHQHPEPNIQEENIGDKDIIVEKTHEEKPSIFTYLTPNADEHYTNDERNQLLPTSDKQIDNRDTDEKSAQIGEDGFCTKENCPNQINPESSEYFLLSMDLLNFGSDTFLYLITTAASVIIFLLGHFALDKSRREGPLIAKINKLEKELLILIKEKEILAEQVEYRTHQDQSIENDDLLKLQEEKQAFEERVQILEDQVQTLEKELENSTEVGLELNRMLSEVLNSENAGQTLMLNIESLQAQLAEQQDIVSNMKEVLSLKETENHELNLELDIANKKVFDLQSELDKLLLNIIKLEEDKESIEKKSQAAMKELNDTINSLKEQLDNNQEEYTKNLAKLQGELSASEHNLQLKTKEYDGLKNSMQQMKEIKNANTLESLFEVNSIKAELEQLKSECQGHCDKLRREKEANAILEQTVKSTEEQINHIKTKFDETDKTRLELETKLQVLSNYFKEKEEQLQMELSKYENMWSNKQGEATSTSERIKYLQSEVQNYKAQNESLKQEIVSQEVELKGQISVLEKKVHENWVTARQAERRLEELKQEAAQLRNRLTLRERALQEDRLHNRIQSPLEQGGDIPVSPLHLESPASPPLLYNSRDHITKSPPILGMPPPFLPPPAGASYLPPPPLPFMPPPPHDMFPGDHRPPPLGRMSSPPLNSRYSPSRPYSPYDRSPSPSYDESEYGTSPVHRRNYSQFNRRRERRPAAMEKFNGRSGTLSSGSDNSNEFLDEINSKV